MPPAPVAATRRLWPVPPATRGKLRSSDPESLGLPVPAPDHAASSPPGDSVAGDAAAALPAAASTSGAGAADQAPVQARRPGTMASLGAAMRSWRTASVVLLS